ncbi:MAG: type IV secretion system DNA-binding domain-containing protein, partial [Rhodospirillales bacterium]|nr:type IV secretion system DNA-binding domain-containing protein [Rhodospirillales bacterium]
FSIRDWISSDRGSGFLFLTSRGDQHASLRGLISTWLEIAVNSMLSLEQDDGRRIWVILDELPTLHQVPSLQPGLAESRQFGGCFVLGVQVASALRDLYGRNGAETISGLCGTRVVFAAPDRDTAQWSADSLGRSEIEEFAEGVSYGADPYRDGVTLTPKREVQALALPSEIMRLPNLNGYLKLPGPYPVARIELDYVKREKVAPRFVARGQEAPDDADGESGEGEDNKRAEADAAGNTDEKESKQAGNAPPPKGDAPEQGSDAAAETPDADRKTGAAADKEPSPENADEVGSKGNARKGKPRKGLIPI